MPCSDTCAQRGNTFLLSSGVPEFRIFPISQFKFLGLKRATVCHVVQCYGHAEQQVVAMELDRREAEAKEAEKRLQRLGAKP